MGTPPLRRTINLQTPVASAAHGGWGEQEMGVKFGVGGTPKQAAVEEREAATSSRCLDREGFGAGAWRNPPLLCNIPEERGCLQRDWGDGGGEEVCVPP